MKKKKGKAMISCSIAVVSWYLAEALYAVTFVQILCFFSLLLSLSVIVLCRNAFHCFYHSAFLAPSLSFAQLSFYPINQNLDSLSTICRQQRKKKTVALGTLVANRPNTSSGQNLPKSLFQQRYPDPMMPPINIGITIKNEDGQNVVIALIESNPHLRSFTPN